MLTLSVSKDTEDNLYLSQDTLTSRDDPEIGGYNPLSIPGQDTVISWDDSAIGWLPIPLSKYPRHSDTTQCTNNHISDVAITAAINYVEAVILHAAHLSGRGCVQDDFNQI